MLTKQETLLGRSAGCRAGGRGSPEEPLCCVGHHPRLYGDWSSFQVVSGRSL